MRQRALDYLGKREYSYLELTHKLKPYTESDDPAIEIKAVLDDFVTRGWLSDARFAEQITHVRQRKFGTNRIANELREKGVSDDLIAEAIDAIKDNEFDNAKQVWQKKYGQAPETREAWAKQARFMQSRGFSFETIKKVIAQATQDNE